MNTIDILVLINNDFKAQSISNNNCLSQCEN